MINNRLVTGILKNFCQKMSINDEESKAFEFLVNYLILSNFEFNKQVDIDLLRSLDVDPDGSTFGLDSVQIFVNDNIVISASDIAIYSRSKSLKVDIVFIQSKASHKTNTGSILKTVTAVKDFLMKGDKHYNKYPTNLQNSYNIYKEIFKFENAQHLENTSPHVHIFFATASDKIHEDIFSFVEEQAIELNQSVPDIKKATIKVIGADYITEMYKETENVVTSQFNFKNKIELDAINGVSASYIGYISGKEFLNLISDFQGELRKWIFYDNVRDFQGEENPVNMEIEKSILDEKERDKFLLYNNGITVVAKSLKPLGSNNFQIKDFQIVNGCQTSNVIFNNKEKAEQINVPIKIIITEDDHITSSIVKANNRQTPVSNEQFITLSAFHRRLQDLYESYSQDMPIKLFYERRSGESKSKDDIGNYEIVTLHSIIRCITATIFREAHVVYNNNPANILRNRPERLFNDEHILEAYYVGNYLLGLFNKLNRNGTISCNQRYKYYIIMIVFMILSNSAREISLKNKDGRDALFLVIEKLKSEDMKKIYTLASNFLEKTIFNYPKQQNDDILRDRQFNKTILEQLQSISRA